MTQHQINLEVCDDCLSRISSISNIPLSVPLIRRSHRWSFWCQHLMEQTGYRAGMVEPILIHVGRNT